MKITYSEIQNDSKKILLRLSESDNTVSSFFMPLKRVSYHLIAYFLFFSLSYFTFPKSNSGDVAIWLGALAFGVVHWFFIFALMFGYENIFSMINSNSIKDMKLVRVASKKVKGYGLAWLICIITFGVVSMTTELNVSALVIGNFIVTILGFFIFNMDISRYQLAGLMGAISATKEKFTQ